MITAAIIGVGEWGQRLVRSVQGKSERIRFVAAVARTPEKARAFAGEQGLALHGALDGALEDPIVNAVVLATPHSQHAELVIAAAAAKKAVFVEKPFTLTRVSAVAAAEACHRAGVTLAVGYNRRFLPAMIALKELVAGGKLGKPLQIEGTFSSNSGYRHGPAAWRASRTESPAGGMTSLGVHLLDAMIDLCGNVKAVETWSRHLALPIDIDDATAVLLQFERGPLGYLGTIFASAPLWRLQVFGSEGWAEMRGPETLVIASRDGKTEERKFPPLDIERAELEAFADAVAGGTAYPVSTADAIHGAAILEAIIGSADAGRVVPVP